MNGETAILAGFCAGLDFDMIPQDVVDRVRLLLLDTIAITVRGRWDPTADSTPPHIAALAAAGLVGGKAHVFGDSAGYSPYAAAMLNGSLSHSLDFDDTHAPAGIHTSAPVIPAAFAAAEIVDADMPTVIAAIVAGYETMTRVSLALSPTDHSDKGFHLTATCGVFAAAAAAGRVLGLSGKQIEDAFGTALSQTAGSGQFLVNGAWTKRFQVGAAAANGLLAACLAKAGYSGAAEAFEGRNGFLKLYGSPASDKALLVSGLGARWETLGIGIKPYPCCRAIHAPIDAALALRELHGLGLSDIASVTIGMARKCVDITGEPQAKKRDPQSIVDGQFSAHFGVAAALEQGGLGWEDYERQLANPQIREILPSIDAFNDPEAQAEYPGQLSGSVTLRLKDGRELRAFVRAPLGEPENMLSVAQLRGKFTSLVQPLLGEGQTNRLFELLAHAGANTSIADILANASVPSPPAGHS